MACFGPERTSDWRDAFVEPTERSSTCVFVARALLAAGWLYCTIWYWVITPIKWAWIIHLTTWGCLVELAYLVLSAVATGVALYGGSGSPASDDGSGDERSSDAGSSHWLATTTWVLGAITPAITAIVCVMFWALEFRPGNPIKLSAVAVHGWNFLFALVDLAITSRPFRLSHVYMPMAFGLSYGAFTLVYYLCGGKHRDGVYPYIYRALDWRNPQQAGLIVLMVGFVAVPLFHTILVGFAWASHRCRGALSGAAAPKAGDEDAAAADAAADAEVAQVSE